MAERTRIQWAESTWDPWRGCTKVSPGCLNCYAEALATRNPAVFGGWGKGAPRVESKSWNEPVTWNRKRGQMIEEHENRFAGSLREAFDPQSIPQGPRRQRVFPSKCDWLDDEVGASLRGKFLSLIHRTPHLLWLLLTKRPENFRRLLENCLAYSALAADAAPGMEQWLRGWLDGRAPANVWIGTSAEDQTRMNERGFHVLQIPAALRFLSIEPLLGPVEIPQSFLTDVCECGRSWPVHMSGCFNPWTGDDDCDENRIIRPKIHWVIVGGESRQRPRNDARFCAHEWIEQIVADCRTVRTPVFVKQLGSNSGFIQEGQPHAFTTNDAKGGEPGEWPPALRVREEPAQEWSNEWSPLEVIEKGKP